MCPSQCAGARVALPTASRPWHLNGFANASDSVDWTTSVVLQVDVRAHVDLERFAEQNRQEVPALDAVMSVHIQLIFENPKVERDVE